MEHGIGTSRGAGQARVEAVLIFQCAARPCACNQSTRVDASCWCYLSVDGSVCVRCQAEMTKVEPKEEA